jgi:ankyrin repeat protein
MLRFLIANGLKPNAYSREDYTAKSALYLAASSGLTTVVKILLRENVNIDHREYSLGRTPLMAATVSDRLEIMQLLLDAGADINLQDKNGNTALAMAARKGRPETVAFLLKHGADKSIRNKDGMTALEELKMWRVERYAASYDAVEKLLKAGP